MNILTFGDSHSGAGWPGYVEHRYYNGPLLCYTLGKEKLRVLNLSLLDYIKDGDVLVFCYGEIDCRCHIKKHITKEKSYQDIIDNLIENYIDTIRINLELIPQKVNPYIYNVVPPVKRENIQDDELFPILGSNEERRDYAQYFNKKAKEETTKIGYGFFDVYNDYADKDGFLNYELSDSSVHIRDEKYIDKFIKENIWKIN